MAAVLVQNGVLSWPKSRPMHDEVATHTSFLTSPHKTSTAFVHTRGASAGISRDRQCGITNAATSPAVLSSVRVPFVTPSTRKATAPTPQDPFTLNETRPCAFVILETRLFVQ